MASSRAVNLVEIVASCLQHVLRFPAPSTAGEALHPKHRPARLHLVAAQGAMRGRNYALLLLLAMLTLHPTGQAQTAHFSDATVSLGGGFYQPSNVAVDRLGNVYVADYGNNAVKEMPAGCASSSCVTTLGGGFSNPNGVAVDASGNVYVADYGNNAVKEMPAGCASSSCVTTLGGGFSIPTGVAVDASGNVYVADVGNNAVKEMPAGCASPSCVTALGGGFLSPTGVTVDGSGNVYVADEGNNAVKKMPAGCNSSSCVTTLGGGFFSPTDVAVDGAGNVYVVDSGNGTVKEMPGGCASSSCVTSLGGPFYLPLGVALDSSGNIYFANFFTNSVNKLMQGAADFGTVNVGSSSATLTLTFIVTGTGTFGTPVALTQGASGLDFAFSMNGCNGTLTAGTICGMLVTFTPKYPGPRMGALQLLDASGNVIATAYLKGIGSGPQIVYPSNNTPGALGGGFNGPYGVAVDGSGNVYVADSSNNAVKEMPAGCMSASCVTTLGGGFLFPNGVAVDGSGNVYVADTDNGAVKEMPAGCANASCVSTLGGGFRSPKGVTVDGSGNIYVADTRNAVMEMPAGCAHASCVTTLGGGFTYPWGVAVDGAGDVYVTYMLQGTLKEIPAGCANSSCVTPLASGLAQPYGVAVDGAGNVYVTDFSSNVLEEFPFATAPSLSYPTATPAGMEDSADGAITVTIANDGNAPLIFAETASTDEFNPSVGTNFLWDSASTCSQATSSSTVTLAAGANCTLAIDFSPLSSTPAGSVSSTVTLTDNTLNATAATQTISLSGTVANTLSANQAITSEVLTYNTAANFTPVTGSGGTPPLTYSISGTLPPGLSIDATTGAISGTPTAISASTIYTVTVTDGNGFTASNSFSLTVNQATQSTLTVTGMPTAAQAYGTKFTVGTTGGNGTGAVSFTASGACSVSRTTVTMISGTGSCSVFASKAADADYLSATSATVSVNATPASPNITWPAASNIYQGQTLAASTLSGGSATYNGANVPGAFTWSASDSASSTYPAVGVTSYNVTFTPTDTSDYTPVTGPVSVTTISINFSVDFTSPITLTVVPGGTATYSFTLTPDSGHFPEDVHYSVSGLPVGSSAAFTPSSIAAGSGTTTVTLVIQTSSTAARAERGTTFGKAAPLALALLFAPLIGLRRRAHRWFLLCCALVALAASTALSGCGGAYFSQAQQSYPLDITITSGVITNHAAATLTVE